MQTLANFIRGATGWRRWGALITAGAASVLGLAPFFAWPVLFVTVPVLVWSLDGAWERAKLAPGALRWWQRPMVRAFGAGWCFGFGYFIAGLFWVGEAFLVQAGKFAVLMPFAVVLLPAGLALFWAGGCAVAAGLRWGPGPDRILALALALAAVEWLRGHVLTGLPWNVIGYALTWPLPLMQSAAVLGIYGLSLLAVPVFAAPVVLWVDGSAARRSRMAGIVFAAACLAALAIFGGVRLSQSDPPANGARVRLVQPSVPQREKWLSEHQERIFREHLDLSVRAASGAADDGAGIALIVWPEAAMPFLPLDVPQATAAIARMLPDGAHLAAGALRVEAPTNPAPQGRWRAYNSLMVFGTEGKLVALYDKIHLVPFGEYLPFQTTLEAIGLEQLTRRRGGFEAGAKPRPLLRVPGLPAISPLICYEALFPGAVVQGHERPAVILNVTNDGWFGDTTGPHQHLHQARVRAVEEGLPLLRAANNGISAIIDARGRVLNQLALNEKGVIDGVLPAAIARPPYARFGDAIFASGWVIALLGLTFAWWRHALGRG